MKIVKKDDPEQKSNKPIYMGIDHLNPGNYELRITLDDKVVKTVALSKNENYDENTIDTTSKT